MAANENVHQHMRRLGALIDCDTVFLVFGCPEQSLRHPLLDRIPIVSYQVIEAIGSVDPATLLQHERILAACDIAIQTGKVQTLNHIVVDAITSGFLSCSIVPLERSAGILGLVLLVNTHPDAFALGEHLLLQQYLPTIAQQVEAFLSNRVEKQAVQSSCQHHAQPEQSQEYMSIMAHELRSPLTAIKGYAALLQAYGCVTEDPGRSENGDISPERRQEYFDIIMEQVQHLEVLISDILDMSRLSSSHLTLHSNYLNCALLCQRTMQIVQQRTDQQHPGKYSFHLNFPAPVPFIWADSNRLQQVLFNLLDNAVKYSPAGGSIELSIILTTLAEIEHERIGQIHGSREVPRTIARVAITVQDEGIGIPRVQQKYLFEPFRRLHGATSHNIPGVGLGLYITCRLVEAMSGMITVSSDEGRGTKVTVSFPIVEAEHHASLEQSRLAGLKQLESKPGSFS